MQTRVLILGAGFGGLELATTLSESLGDQADVTVIDKSDSFVFGYAKLDVMFGRATPEAARLPYGASRSRACACCARRSPRSTPRLGGWSRTPGHTTQTSWSWPWAPTTTWTRRPDWPREATSSTRWPGPSGCERCCRSFSSGHAIVGVCGAPFKCPPAPSECALLLHDMLSTRGVRDACRISIVIPFDTPVPPSPDTSMRWWRPSLSAPSSSCPTAGSRRSTRSTRSRC